MKILIVVPAYNEEAVIFNVLKDIRQKTRGLQNKTILVIDDGSSDNTFHQAKKARVKVIRHLINRGLGGALGTGLEYARRHCFSLMVTLDADGQHDPSDIFQVIKPITNHQADVVIGSRTLSKHGRVPWDRRLLITASNNLTELFFGQITTDSQSGFRAFNQKAINHIRIKTDRMEVSSEFFSEIRRLRLRLTEVPIKVIYTQYSRRKGQSNLNAIHIIFKLILRLFR